MASEAEAGNSFENTSQNIMPQGNSSQAFVHKLTHTDNLQDGNAQDDNAQNGNAQDDNAQNGNAQDDNAQGKSLKLSFTSSLILIIFKMAMLKTAKIKLRLVLLELLLHMCKKICSLLSSSLLQSEEKHV